MAARGRAAKGLVLRLADGFESDCVAGFHLAREMRQHRGFRDIPFSIDKVRVIFKTAKGRPDRNAVPAGKPLSKDGLCGFAAVRAGEYFLEQGTLIATVLTLNISRKLSGALLAARWQLI